MFALPLLEDLEFCIVCYYLKYIVKLFQPCSTGMMKDQIKLYKLRSNEMAMLCRLAWLFPRDFLFLEDVIE